MSKYKVGMYVIRNTKTYVGFQEQCVTPHKIVRDSCNLYTLEDGTIWTLGYMDEHFKVYKNKENKIGGELV